MTKTAYCCGWSWYSWHMYSIFFKKSGFKVTLIDKNDPGTMTSYGHACTFADYACVPVNSPDLFKEIPQCFKK